MTVQPIRNLLPINEKELDRRSIDQRNKYADLANELVNILGLGSQPATRRSFYRKIEDLCVKHGDGFYRPVWRIVQKSIGKDYPDRYFCVSAKRLIGVVESVEDFDGID